MKYIDLTFPTPEHNLACDEALLEMCEEDYDHEILRFWEPKGHFVVLGYSRKIHLDVNLPACEARNVPIFRRPSGGGTVLQGPGCLNFSVVLKIKNSKPLKNIIETNCFVMKQNKEALEAILGNNLKVQGSSDLTLGDLKFSGNAQRRKRHFLLFHGTFLLSFDISLIEKLLPIPSKQPSYRNGRSHASFLTNLNIPVQKIKEALQKSWKANEPFEHIPTEKINQLVKNQYTTRDWNYKF